MDGRKPRQSCPTLNESFSIAAENKSLSERQASSGQSYPIAGQNYHVRQGLIEPLLLPWDQRKASIDRASSNPNINGRGRHYPRVRILCTQDKLILPLAWEAVASKEGKKKR